MRIIAMGTIVTGVAAPPLVRIPDAAQTALIARDPSKLPLEKGARYTENGVTLELGGVQDLKDSPILSQPLAPSEKATDKNTPFDKDCKRIENGARMSCGAQFATGFSKIITHVRERGFPVVDSGRNKTTVWNDGKEHPVNTPFDVPISFQIGDLFKIRNGKILQIEALVLNVPDGMPTGWK
jgi:hypothetical protein